MEPVSTKKPLYENFYENVQEANKRLRGTVVLYDGEPCLIMTVVPHKDNVFRVYLEPTNNPDGPATSRFQGPWQSIPYDHSTFAAAMDAWLETPDGKTSGMMRKKMNSPHFNKFRPFPLGMTNYRGQCIYIERAPNRKGEQGLLQSMMSQVEVSLDLANKGPQKGGGVPIVSPQFSDCILGKYPTFKDCLTALADPKVVNKSVGFHRNFALLRGPVDTMFLAYKTDLVGVISPESPNHLKLGKSFAHVREAVEELNIFTAIIT